MENHKGPVIVIMITVLVALGNFLLFDHSGITVTDISIEENTELTDNYNLTYYLRNGRTFNVLICEYAVYDDKDRNIANSSEVLEKVYSGSHTISSNILINNTTKEELNIESNNLPPIKRVEINIYDKRFKSDKSNKSEIPEPVYTKIFNNTN